MLALCSRDEKKLKKEEYTVLPNPIAVDSCYLDGTYDNNTETLIFILPSSKGEYISNICLKSEEKIDISEFIEWYSFSVGTNVLDKKIVEYNNIVNELFENKKNCSCIYKLDILIDKLFIFGIISRYHPLIIKIKLKSFVKLNLFLNYLLLDYDEHNKIAKTFTSTIYQCVYLQQYFKSCGSTDYVKIPLVGKIKGIIIKSKTNPELKYGTISDDKYLTSTDGLASQYLYCKNMIDPEIYYFPFHIENHYHKVGYINCNRVDIYVKSESEFIVIALTEADLYTINGIMGYKKIHNFLIDKEL